MRSKTVDRLLKSTPEEVKIFVDLYADLVVRMRGAGGDHVGHLVLQMEGIANDLNGIKDALENTKLKGRAGQVGKGELGL